MSAPLPSPRRLLVLAATGGGLLALGLIAAAARLPEWRHPRIPEERFFTARLAALAERAGLQLVGPASVELRSKGSVYDELLSARDTTYEHLGPEAADWRARNGRGPFVDTVAASLWRTDPAAGELRVLFSLHGEPVAATWMPHDPFRPSPNASTPRALRRDALARMFTPAHDEASSVDLEVLTQSIRLIPIPSTNPAETLLASSTAGIAPAVQREVGSVDQWRTRFESLSVTTLLTRNLPYLSVSGLFYIGTLVVFVVLLVRRRIEVVKGTILGIVSIALSLGVPLRGSVTMLQVLDSLVDILAKGVGLFILWSAAESWLRSTMPSFRTSLDMLRAGRLGPASGAALLSGTFIGAAVAGMSLAALSAATLIPGVAPTDGSVHLPIFAVDPSPIDEGAIRAGIVILAVCAGMRLPIIRRVRGGATVLAAAVLATRIPLWPFWIACALGLLLAVIFVRTHARFGLTALLAATMASTVLPATIFSWRHFSWLSTSAVLLAAFALLPVVAGVIGIGRSAESEARPFRLPGFVKRLEEESRLKYEMDLLTRMQLGLLPSETPQVAGYEIAARSILASEAGGDLYDFIRDERGRLWIAAGDVSGHGYSCAIAQAMTKAGLASLVEGDRTPAAVLDRLDRVLRGMSGPRTFTTLVLLRLDPATGEMLVSNAAHPYPLIARHGTPTCELELPSLPLGQGPSRRYTDATLIIESGTTLVLSSDGLFEATDANGEPYGFERLHNHLSTLCRRPAAAILDAIVEHWRAYAGPAAPDDDTTLVVIKRV